MHLALVILVWCAAVGVSVILCLGAAALLGAVLDIILDGRAARQRANERAEYDLAKQRRRDEERAQFQAETARLDAERTEWAKKAVALERERAKERHPSNAGGPGRG